MTMSIDPILRHATGSTTGVLFPADPRALIEAGPRFLTDAFRAFGALAFDNEVARIVRVEPCPGGSTGAKLFLTVEYTRADPDLRSELFVKFSRDFDDPLRDWQRYEMEPEVRLAAVSRRPGFPIDVPAAFFADFEHDSGTGLIIAERIFFGTDGVEPHRGKCLDHLTLDDPLPHYSAIISALARLAAAHKSGALAPDLDIRFPFDPATGSADPISFDQGKLEKRLVACADFAERCPQLLPDAIRSPDFIASFERDALRIHAHETDIQRILCADPDLIALGHWNAHIDNAWFRRNKDGALRCGLLDWGRVGQLTLGSILWGCLSAAHQDVWNSHLDTLLALFVDEYRRGGGPAVDVDRLAGHLGLHMALMGVSRLLTAPAYILSQLPAAEKASGPLDPLFLTHDVARTSLHLYTTLLGFWQRRNLGAQLERLISRRAITP